MNRRLRFPVVLAVLVCEWFLLIETTEAAAYPVQVSQRPLLLMAALGALALVPFVLIMITSFVKIAVVLSIIRSALGTQQVPPNQVVIGLAVILTIHIMVPVGLEVYRETQETVQQRTGKPLLSEASLDLLGEAVKKGKTPIFDFLYKHSHSNERRLFLSMGRKMRKQEDRENLKERDATVLIPAFVISELKEAFQIGFIIFVPFLVVDMVVANVLMSMGMFMLSPTMISLPFKLLLFVLVDGWYVITKGLIMGYL